MGAEIILAFKRDYLFNGTGVLSKILPSFINVKTLVHVEILISVYCIKTNYNRECEWCKKTLDRAHNGKHWLSYFISVYSNWQRLVDDKKFRNDMEDCWFFLSIPMLDSQRCQSFLDYQIAKPLNYYGFAVLPFGLMGGCRLDTPNPKMQPTWFCSELIAAALRDQGYTHYFNEHPCLMRPIDIYDKALSIPGSRKLNRHPAY